MSLFQKLALSSATEGQCTESERRIRRRASIRHTAPPIADVATQHLGHAPDMYQPSLSQHVTTGPLSQPAGKKPRYGLVLLGMAIMLMLYLLSVNVVLPWVIDKIDHWTTGQARIWQCDLNVGHAGSSHFLTQYYQDRVLVVEVSNSNPTIVHTYVIPAQFVTPPLAPPIITLAVQDINGDHLPDLLVHIEGVASPIPLYNNGHAFQFDDPTRRKG
jgi:hypothetical protein